MPQVVLEIVLPLILPMAIYFLWIAAFRRDRGAALGRATPWVWLLAAGAVLLTAVLVLMAVEFGGPRHGVYVPPRWVDGHIIPGHVERTSPGRQSRTGD